MDRGDDPTRGGEAPWSTDAGPEPEWADAIPKGRKARGERLREVFAVFDDDAGPGSSPRRPASREGDTP
jgi:hypothetical protein